MNTPLPPGEYMVGLSAHAVRDTYYYTQRQVRKIERALRWFEALPEHARQFIVLDDHTVAERRGSRPLPTSVRSLALAHPPRI